DVHAAVAGGGAQPEDLGPELGQAAPVGVADDRDDQPVGRRHRQPDVPVGVHDDLAPGAPGAPGGCLQRGVEDGEAAQAPGDGGHQEGADGGLDAGVGQPATGGQQAGGV